MKKRPAYAAPRGWQTLALLLLTLLLAGCAASGGSQAQAGASLALTSQGEDAETRWNDSATRIALDPQGIHIQGPGAMAQGQLLTVSQAGVYVLSGTLDNGQILVDAPKGALVRLVLKGVTVANQTGAALYVTQCRKLVVTLAPDTQNALTDGGDRFTYQDPEEKEPNAAFFAKNDLTLNGDGSLRVNAAFQHGITAKDNLLILGGQVVVDAADSALRGNDSVTVAGGVLTLKGRHDGIQTHNDQEADKGWVLLSGGVVDIACGYDGVQADRALTVTGGVVTITSGVNRQGDSHSQKGLKARGDLTVRGGVLTIQSPDDSLHAKGHMEIAGGVITLDSGDDAIHADGDFLLQGGEVRITRSHEGIEAARITIQGGVVDITSAEDGINASGEGKNGSGENAILISGGSVQVLAGGDGLDSNGSLTVLGGQVLCLIQSTPDNGAMDCDGAFTVSGGVLIYGGSGTGRTPTGQPYVRFSVPVAEGTPLELGQGGQTLAAFTPGFPCRELVFCVPGLVSGQEYQLMSGGQVLGTTQAEIQAQ